MSEDGINEKSRLLTQCNRASRSELRQRHKGGMLCWNMGKLFENKTSPKNVKANSSCRVARAMLSGN